VNPGLVIAALIVQAGLLDADEHMLAGAELFRTGRFAEALVEFRVAERLGDPDAARYAGVALVKLGRDEEAIEALGEPRQEEDPLMAWYRALACHAAGLNTTADRLLSELGGRAGPRIAEQALRLRAELRPLLAAAPARAAVDAALERCAASQRAGRPRLAAAVCRDAASLASRRSDRYRLAEAEAAFTDRRAKP
jgi:hypothetical protein